MDFKNKKLLTVISLKINFVANIYHNMPLFFFLEKRSTLILFLDQTTRKAFCLIPPTGEFLQKFLYI